MKIYTKTGDDGTTGLLGAKRVRKDDVRIEAYGEIDELNAAIGLLMAHLSVASTDRAPDLTAVQNDLFVLGTILATPAQTPKALATLDPARIHALETAIDAMEKELPPLKSFILPQGSPGSTYAHLARAICRRAERRVVALSGLEEIPAIVLPYINRLSDYLFVAARWINQRDGGSETPWINGPAAATVQTDLMGATLQKIEDDKKKRQTLFEKASADLTRKKEMAEKLFKKNVDQINRDGGKVEKPTRDLDLD